MILKLKSTSIFAVVWFLVCSGISFSQTAEPPPNFAVADGSPSQPYVIETWQNLYWLSQNPGQWDRHYVQTDDIEFPTSGSDDIKNWDNGAGWAPIGRGPVFTGGYDGGAYVIRNLYINRPSTNIVGLFSEVRATAGAPSVVRRVGLMDHDITGGTTVGGIVGRLTGVWNAPAVVQQSFTQGVTRGNNNVGGIVGATAYQGRIENAYAVGVVEIPNWRAGGGITGTHYSSGPDAVINNVFAAVQIVALGSQTGGLVGAGSGTVTNSFWDTQASGLSVSAGGTGKTTAEMKDIATFTATATPGLTTPWDFAGNPNDDTGNDHIWKINPEFYDGYPFAFWLVRDYYSRQSGVWDTASTWSINDCDQPVQHAAGHFPVDPLNATICPDNEVTLETSLTTSGALTVNTDATFIISGTGALAISGAIENFGSLNICGTLSASAEATTSSTMTISGIAEFSGSLAHSDTPIVVESDALFHNTTATSPELIMRRELLGFDSVNPQDGEGWRYISSPSDVNLSVLLAPIWTQGLSDNPSSGNTGAGIPNVYRWSTGSEGNDPGDWVAVTDLDVPATPGEGLLVYVYAADMGEINPGENLMLEIQGEEFGSFSVTTNENAGNGGWTLLGNPFATSISFELLRNSASSGSIANAVYVWTPIDTDGDGGQDPGNAAGSWRAWSSDGSLGLGDLTDGLIAPFQAFFVENAEGDSEVNLTFSNDIKTSANPKFLFKQTARNLLRLELAGEGMRNSAWLSFSGNGSSTERVGGDAWQLDPMSVDYALLASEKQGVGLLDIGHYPIDENLIIPLVALATRPGTYRISVTRQELNGLDLYLNDLETRESMPLTENMSYDFTIGQAAKTAPADPFASIAAGPMKSTIAFDARFTISAGMPAAENTETPVAVTLHQNYPNPFNPVTQIRFELPARENVRLTVFDLLGRLVAVLVDEIAEAGSHTVNFDASSLSSGVYTYRLQAGTTVLTRKMTVVK